MSVCAPIKGFARRHELVADFFSLLAAALLFASVWAILQYHSLLLLWVKQNALLHTPALVAAAALDVLLIFGFLCAGASRCEEGSCFRTFRGRRHGGAALGKVFGNWLHHIEHVGRRHR